MGATGAVLCTPSEELAKVIFLDNASQNSFTQHRWRILGITVQEANFSKLYQGTRPMEILGGWVISQLVCRELHYKTSEIYNKNIALYLLLLTLGESNM